MKNYLIYCTVLCLFVACTSNDLASIPSSDDNVQQESYPIIDDDAYPVVETADQIFKLAPIENATTTITGEGKAGIMLEIVSITHMGELLGDGVVDDNGIFEMTINRPVLESEKIGVQFKDKAMVSQFGEMKGSIDIPLIGHMLDAITVTMP